MSVAITKPKIERYSATDGRHLGNRRSLGLHWGDQSRVQSGADAEGGVA
jgi:hypothetical protein